MRCAGKKVLPLLGVLIICGLAVIMSHPASARGASGSDRGLDMYFTYPQIIIPEGTTSVDAELSFKNTGKRGETVVLDLSDVPEGWKARIKSYAFDVTATRIPPEEERLTTLTLEPDADAKPGVYKVGVTAQTGDGAFKKSETLQVTVRAKEEVKGTVELVSSYPVLQGSTDVSFEFALNITNRTRKEQAFNLLADPPRDWQVNFKPPFKEKFVSSIIMKADENQSVNVEVVPNRFAEAGEYNIPVKVAAGDITAETNLKVIITGTYSLNLGTQSDLLSLEVEKGKPVKFSIYVRNTGSATIQDIGFLSMKPENWEVKFEPETIDSLDHGSTKQVEMTIIPAEEALVGDYALGVSADSKKSSDDIELRVTVKASAAWGWIGIAIIMFVIIGLLGLFMTLGRR
ncbi:MAG: hypothetical protein AVO39_02890 [delta proteobacterium MLS_D]|jgi:uncharacterized membrane protein|nr:MAG: hypothetical protein AVO39_02890 [delta proteobacterium MLS_D]